MAMLDQSEEYTEVPLWEDPEPGAPSGSPVRVSVTDNLGYISLSAVEPGDAAYQREIQTPGGNTIVLDFDEDGRILGIEVLDARMTLRADTLVFADDGSADADS